MFKKTLPGPVSGTSSTESPTDSQKETWTESVFSVEKIELFREQQDPKGKDDLVSLLLELKEEERETSNPGERSTRTLFLGLGAASRDIPTFSQVLLGRKVHLTQLRREVDLEKDDLLSENLILREEVLELTRKVRYLNDSLHSYFQGSREAS
jgi:hypothetical protein